MASAETKNAATSCAEVPASRPLYWMTFPGAFLTKSGPVTLVKDPSAFIVARVTGIPITGCPATFVYVTDRLQVFWFVEVVTTHEPESDSLLGSERTPAPTVVDAVAVVEAVDASITLVEVPRSAGPTIEPWPGRA